MDEQTKLSRGQFLGIVGGMALTAVVFKFSTVRNILSGVSTKKDASPRIAAGAYGNHTYGGKNA